MKKENLTKLVKELNDKKDIFIAKANKNENSFFHMDDISFSKVKEEYWNGDLPSVIEYALKISVKRKERKNKHHYVLDICSENLADKIFFDTCIPDDICKYICWYISIYSSKLLYIQDTRRFVTRVGMW